MKRGENSEKKDLDAKWREKYACLRAYYEREGHCRVPARFTDQNGFKLGIWVKAQREKQERLSEERRLALEQIPGWFWRGQDAKWEHGYALLKEYVKKNGHARVPKLDVIDNYRLGVWVMHQRSAHKSGRLNDLRRRKLERLPGWFWTYDNVLPTRVDVSKATKIVWRALIGTSPMSPRELRKHAARVLHEEQLIYSDELAPKCAAMEDIKSVIKNMHRRGYLEKLDDGNIRIVVRQAYQYRPEYWRLCILNSCNNGALPPDDLLLKAAFWARDNLGLKLKQFRPGGRIARELESALKEIITDGELCQSHYGMVGRQQISVSGMSRRV